jgi:hypothetical protein
VIKIGVVIFFFPAKKWYIIGGVIAGGALLIVFILFCCIKKIRHRSHDIPTETELRDLEMVNRRLRESVTPEQGEENVTCRMYYDPNMTPTNSNYDSSFNSTPTEPTFRFPPTQIATFHEVPPPSSSSEPTFHFPPAQIAAFQEVPLDPISPTVQESQL